MAPRETPAAAPTKRGRPPSAALAVVAGIFASRVFGLVRERVLAHFLGAGEAAGAYRAATRIPNVLQNLFGEGALSASFIPVYARLLAEGREKEAKELAGTVLGLLAGVVTLLTAALILCARPIVRSLTAGFTPEIQELTVSYVIIILPGIAFLVLAAWCLGVLNSHRRFFTSYAAPVAMNLAVILALVGFGWAAQGDQHELGKIACYGTVAGALLQLLVQVPLALRLVGREGLRFLPSAAPVRRVLKSFAPALMSRGVVQISAYLDQWLAGFLGPSVLAATGYAQNLYMLPFSLISTAITATELPEMSRSLAGDHETTREALRKRLAAGLARVGFFMTPAIVAFVLLGDVAIALLYQTGRFTAEDVPLVNAVLSALALGLGATSRTRLLSSAFWALEDTRTPLNFAVLRILLATATGYAVVQWARERFGFSVMEATFGFTLASSCGAWIEFGLSTRALRARIGAFGQPWRDLAKPWVAALVAGGLAWGLAVAMAALGPIVRGVSVLGVFGAVYLGLTTALRVPTASEVLGRFRK